jgi:hypothetical protein
LSSQFKDVIVGVETPYVVRDRVIFGEVFSLIPLESTWCRGYMMLQTGEQAMLEVVKMDKTHVATDSANFRNVNNILSEVTNLIWGAFKNRYISDEDRNIHFHSQVPIIINHKHKYISFGSENPQLCFKYTLTDPNNSDSQPVIIYQRFVFNLTWSPEDFKENQASVEELVDSGELEMF